MGRTQTCEAIVLQVHDVGEADRFCILLTREHGRLAARARAVRKPKSRMGGSLLPLHCSTVELHEGATGFLITGVHNSSKQTPTTIQSFMHAMQGIELILKLIEDGEEVPEVFDLTKEFLEHCRPNHSLVLPFTIRLLSLLGLAPQTEQSDLIAQMSPEEKVFFLGCTKATWATCTCTNSTARLQKICEEIIGQQNARELRAGNVAKATMASAS